MKAAWKSPRRAFGPPGWTALGASLLFAVCVACLACDHCYADEDSKTNRLSWTHTANLTNDEFCATFVRTDISNQWYDVPLTELSDFRKAANDAHATVDEGSWLAVFKNGSYLEHKLFVPYNRWAEYFRFVQLNQAGNARFSVAKVNIFRTAGSQIITLTTNEAAMLESCCRSDRSARFLVHLALTYLCTGQTSASEETFYEAGKLFLAEGDRVAAQSCLDILRIVFPHSPFEKKLLARLSPEAADAPPRQPRKESKTYPHRVYVVAVGLGLATAATVLLVFYLVRRKRGPRQL